MELSRCRRYAIWRIPFYIAKMRLSGEWRLNFSFDGWPVNRISQKVLDEFGWNYLKGWNVWIAKNDQILTLYGSRNFAMEFLPWRDRENCIGNLPIIQEVVEEFVPVMWSETAGLRTRPVWDQKNRSWSWSCTLRSWSWSCTPRSWSWSCRSGIVLWNMVLSRSTSWIRHLFKYYL